MRPAGEMLLHRSHDEYVDATEALYFFSFFFMANTSPTSSAQAPATAPIITALSKSDGHSPSVALGVPYKDTINAANVKIVHAAVSARFPDWADQCRPYVNVLTLKAWNQRGYRVKKGEKAIRVFTKVPVTEKDATTGEEKVVGSRPAPAFVFALPQVEKKA